MSQLSPAESQILLAAMLQAQLQGNPAAVQVLASLAQSPDELRQIVKIPSKKKPKRPRLKGPKVRHKSLLLNLGKSLEWKTKNDPIAPPAQAPQPKKPKPSPAPASPAPAPAAQAPAKPSTPAAAPQSTASVPVPQPTTSTPTTSPAPLSERESSASTSSPPPQGTQSPKISKPKVGKVPASSFAQSKPVANIQQSQSSQLTDSQAPTSTENKVAKQVNPKSIKVPRVSTTTGTQPDWAKMEKLLGTEQYNDLLDDYAEMVPKMPKDKQTQEMIHGDNFFEAWQQRMAAIQSGNPIQSQSTEDKDSLIKSQIRRILARSKSSVSPFWANYFTNQFYKDAVKGSEDPTEKIMQILDNIGLSKKKANEIAAKITDSILPLLQIPDSDWRPNETIPEDYYAL